MTATLNLLNYPGLDRQRRRFHRRWTSAAGLVVGGLLAGLLLYWGDHYIQVLEQEQQHLKAKVSAQKAQQQVIEKSQLQQGQGRLQWQHLQQVAHEHKAWEALNLALQQEAGHGTLYLLSLQLTQDRLELQGRAKDLQSMNQARERLSQELRGVLSLTRAQFVGDVGGLSPGQTRVERSAAVEFVWQVDGSVLRARQEKPVDVLSSGSSKRASP